MAFLAKIGLSIGLIFSSIFGLFHHGQNLISTSTIATSTPQVVQSNSQTSATTTILDAQGNSSFYFKDKSHVYWNGSDDPNYKPLLVSNYPDSFVALGSHDLYSDGHQIFQEESVSPDFVLSNDAAHFHLISSSTNQYIVAKDSSYYYMGSHQSLQLIPTQHPEEWPNQILGQ